jgi:putative phage-type endonuclease
MTLIRTTPATREDWLAMRRLDVTSTETPALFGLSPYLTDYQLWFQKRDQDTSALVQSERMEIGLMVEETIARAFAAREGLKIRKLNQYVRDPDLRMGASFDFEIVGHDRGPGLLEVKNVDRLVFRDQWVDSETQEIQPPPHIELQIAHQMAILNRRWGIVVALVGGNHIESVLREQDPEITEDIKRKIAGFWDSIRTGMPPAPHRFLDSEYLIHKVYGCSTEGRLADLREDDDLQHLADQYSSLSATISKLEAEKKALKVDMLAVAGDAEIALLKRGKLSLKMVKESVVPEHTRQGFRMFRYTPKKEN